MQTRSSIKHCLSGSLFCGLVLFALPVGAGVPGPLAAASFYQDTKHGWFWYEDPPPDQEEVQQEPPEVAPGPGHSIARNPSLAQYSTEALWDMHPDDFQQLLNGLQKKAVQYPTEQHILEYLSIQDIARRKALAYANVTQFVTQKRADLFNINQVYPTSSPGTAARVQLQQDEISETISTARSDHALLFFVAPGCGFCEKQTQIIAYFIERYGWQVKPVDISREPNVALRFNVTTTPTLLLIKQDREQSMPIATGVVTLPEMERKLYQSIRYMRGETTMDSFTTYDFQKDSALDPASILKAQQPWKGTGQQEFNPPPEKKP